MRALALSSIAALVLACSTFQGSDASDANDASDGGATNGGGDGPVGGTCRDGELAPQRIYSTKSKLDGVTTEGSELFVSHGDDQTILVLDRTTGAVKKTLTMDSVGGGKPLQLARDFDRTRKGVYFAQWHDDGTAETKPSLVRIDPSRDYQMVPVANGLKLGAGLAFGDRAVFLSQYGPPGQIFSGFKDKLADGQTRSLTPGPQTCNGSAIEGLTAQGRLLYVTCRDLGEVRRIDLDTDAVTTLVTDLGAVAHIAIQSDNLFVARPDAREIAAFNKMDGSRRCRIRATEGPIGGLTVVGGDLYWTEYTPSSDDGTAKWMVMRRKL